MRIGTTCKILILLVIYLGLTACVSSTKTARSSPYILNKASSLGSLKSTTSDTAIDISKVETPDGDLWDDFRGNIELNSYANKREVIAQIHWYQNHQQYLNRSLMRGSPYLYYIYQETQKRHLPAELALVPLNESAYDPFLFSKAGATGLWQMMPGTASGFGLKINWWYDGRRDVVASTNAALKYLTYLHYYFNDWLLAIAAYNSGEGTVQAAVLHNKRHNLPTDFWSLPLPKETRGYVPKLLALAEIFKNPDEYGIKLLPVNSAPYFEQVDVGSQLELNQAASLAGVSAAAMHTLNPGYRRWAMDPDGPYKLLIPAASVDSFKQRLDNLPEHARVHWKKHLVTRNETPKSIAQKYHCDLSALLKINEINSNKVRPGEELLIPSVHNELVVTQVTYNASIAEEKIPGPKQVVHTVKSGETLGSVAKKYGVKPIQVAYWNQLNRDENVEADDELVIWKDPSSLSAKPVQVHCFKYKVKRGDTAFNIAKRYHASISQLKSINNLKSNAVKVGQVLKVPGKSKNQVKEITNTKAKVNTKANAKIKIKTKNDKSCKNKNIKNQSVTKKTVKITHKHDKKHR